MASLGGIAPGFIPVEIKKPKPKRKRKDPGKIICAACSYQEERNLINTQRWYSEDDKWHCPGCINFFGAVDGRGYTSDTPEEATDKLKQIKAAGHIMVLHTHGFGGVATGVSIQVDFGDVFLVARVGTTEKTDWGKSKGSFKRFTIDIQVGPEIVTFYTHEIAPVPWLEIMQLRKDGIIEESFVSKDCQGYFTPTEAGRELLTDMYGKR